MSGESTGAKRGPKPKDASQKGIANNITLLPSEIAYVMKWQGNYSGLDAATGEPEEPTAAKIAAGLREMIERLMKTNPSGPLSMPPAKPGARSAPGTRIALKKRIRVLERHIKRAGLPVPEEEGLTLAERASDAA